MINKTVEIILLDGNEWIELDIPLDTNGLFYADDNSIWLNGDLNPDIFDDILVHELTHWLYQNYPYIAYDIVNSNYSMMDFCKNGLFEDILNMGYPLDVNVLREECYAYCISDLFDSEYLLNHLRCNYDLNLIFIIK